MKFYETNKKLSLFIMALSGINIGLWMAIMVLHFVNSQGTNIHTNGLFQDAYNTCSQNFKNVAYGGLTYAMALADPIPEYGTLLVQNHQNYQTLSLILLFGAGPFELIVLILGFFLMLKSRVPYKKMWYLFNLQFLRVTIYVLTWTGLVCGAMYFGYILNFYLKLGAQDCTSDTLKAYGNGYFVNMILGGIMTFFSILNYFMAMSVNAQPQHMQENRFKIQQESNIALQPIQIADPSAQRAVVQQLHNIPKINPEKQGANIQMTEQQPYGLLNYVTEQALVQPNQNNLITQQSQHENYAAQNYRIPSRFVPPSPLSQINSEPHFYMPSAHQPLEISQIDVNIDERYGVHHVPTYQKNYTHDNFLGEAYVSPSKQGNRAQVANNSNQVSPSQKERLKIFHRGTNGSKQKSIIQNLKSRYGNS